MERSKYFRMLSVIRQQFYSNEFKKLKGDTKQLYKLVAKLTGNIKKNNLPDHASSDVISENLAGFFLNKILKIRDNLEQYDLYTYEWSQVHFPMASLKEVDEMCVQKALTELQAKSCEQDQIPTKIVKSRIDTFIKPYTKW